MRGLFSRWFGRGVGGSGKAPVSLGLQVAFAPRVCALSPRSLSESLSAFHPSLRKVSVSVTSYSDDDGGTEDGFIGSLQWTSPLVVKADRGLAQHRVAAVVQNAYQLPADARRRLSEHALAEDALLSARVDGMHSIVFLSYKGDDAEALTPLQQYAALSMVAGGIATHATDALAILNIRAGCATPSTLFSKNPELLQGILPDGTFNLASHPQLASCFCGAGSVAELSTESQGLHCFRTYGAELLNRPNMLGYGTTRASETSLFYAATNLWYESLVNETPLSAGQVVPMPRFVTGPSGEVQLCRPTLDELDAMRGDDAIVLKPVNGTWKDAPPLNA